jgi:lipoprotein-releasing system permease protein
LHLPSYIAKRYLFSKKTHNIINIISLISIAGISIGTAALIIVLSVFNGFEGLVVSLYNAFDPDMQITVMKGKTFDLTRFPLEKIQKLKGIAYAVPVLEENALLKYKDKQYIASIKGVGEGYNKVSGLDTMIINGEFSLSYQGHPMSVVGFGVAHNLSLEMNDLVNPIEVFVPKKGKVSISNPEYAFNQENMWPSGIFSIQHEFDTKYMIVSLPFIQKLIEAPDKASSIEIKLFSDAEKEAIQDNIKKLLGNEYEVKNRFEQHAILYKIMKSEKWAVYFILSFILLIATFNMVGSLTMLIMDKKKDIAILRSLGSRKATIIRIFFAEGIFISGLGALSGLSIGLLICFSQIYFGFIPLNTSGGFVIDSYPVEVKVLDIVAVFFTVLLISLFAMASPLYKLSQEVLHIGELRNE